MQFKGTISIDKNGVKITHFPVTLSEPPPCLNCGEDEVSSCKVTKAPELIEDEEAIEQPVSADSKVKAMLQLTCCI